MMKTFSFKIRAVQLDLARQMERLDFIFEFIDFIENAGYNTLVLYLEGRIKTKSFPYPAGGEYYTPEEMKSVVAYAAKKNIDVIPVVSVLGHAELFLKHKELASLSEIRGDAKSIFGGTLNHVFCPSSPETFDFIKKYLSEIVAIFPSKYFHVGCDEAWDFGCCSICRDRVHNGESHGDVFAKYLTDVHRFLTKDLKKEMIIWDDMLETYPDALEKIPRDIILCCWNYDRCVDLPKAHFKSRLEEDLFAKYDKLGFRYLFAPSTYLVGNIESFTAYASKHTPLGGLLTLWEKSLNLMHEVMPLVHYAGKLWTDENTDFGNSMKEVFGCGDKLFIDALRSYYEIKLVHSTRLSPESYLAGPLSEFEAVIKSSSEVNAEVFRIYIEKCRDNAPRNMIEDMLLSLDWRRIMFKLRIVMEELYSFGEERPDIARRTQTTAGAAEMIDDFLKKKLEQSKRFRDGLSTAKIEKKFTGFRKEILKLAETSAKATGVLEVKFFLPDMYNAQKCAFTIEFEDGSMEKVADGVFKNYELNDCYFIFKFPYYTDREPVSIRIESWLYGGMGIAYLEAVSNAGGYVPACIKDVRGDVQSPQHILINDLRFCHFGETDMSVLFQMPELAQRKHSLKVILTTNKAIRL
jgi:hypothetical protein